MTEERQVELFNSCIDVLESCLDSVDKYSADEEKTTQNQYIKNVLTKQYCLIDLKFDKAMDAIKKTEEHLSGDNVDPQTDVAQIYKGFLENCADDDYLTHPIWYRISKAEPNSVQEITECNAALANEEYEVLDDSLMCSQATGLPLDPITKMAIKNPCRNKKCGHIYDNDNIITYINRKKAVSCPYVGCGNNRMRASDIVVIDSLKVQKQV